ncbi:MAG: hypothetical protein UU85_C0001G0011 [Candidatus Wolfebacteria bacterium GW2011_GWA2_42_10]|uniref:Uncharacterized protein n=2 Tax=Candidatus Wolfeibacteriota TaxID=1752735 RepID=A0A0G0XM83_9BACT|nr:MAG: hypothetical protein UU38_C0003G0079 [Candidatus Wolfebacteria bacterium GW2011_GWB1_41_12]KKS25582.1 MAG: hypothetical protein UU85_C0001G0011 [Candidatus Wolfebacteria bacterium GW2011_GWA2_42_10]KKT56527.1 MAG: hypothetical protein UW50_C0001G0095 [Candidatus Wolfebacteria bacterium GW2011_GWA1_44_24]
MNNNPLLSTSLIFSSVLIAGALIYGAGLKAVNAPESQSNFAAEEIIPANGVELPVKWGNLGKQLVESGAIDANKFEMLYNQRGGLNNEDKNLLYGENNGNLTIDSENAGYILNLFWAFGLANKNEILENGPMTDSQYGGAGNFASTGGWTMSQNDTMNHYSKHQFIDLTNEQQSLVERVSKNIYRPCCGNSTYFPDCNHGMAMLGLLELMANQGVSESDMYRVALIVNSYWFPDTYLTIAKYFQNRGVDWENVDPKEILSSAYFSASGYQQILSEVEPIQPQGGGGCGV